ncbi:MAG: GspH/FimT family pseudopilin [Aeromonas sp.]
MERQAFAKMKNAGFTLIELMIAIALGVILLGIGIPSLTNLLRSNNLATQEKSLLNHLNYARQQAVSNQQTVTLCLSTINNSTESCLAANQVGATRLLTFVDSNSDQILNGSDTTLSTTSTFPDDLTIAADVQVLRFIPDGTITVTTTATFSLCISGENGVEIEVMPSGRTHRQATGALCP